MLGVLAAWYGSLQHEVIHGHPTPWRLSTPRWPSRPSGSSSRSPPTATRHLAHHRVAGARPNRVLDPESFHVTAGDLGPLRTRPARARCGRCARSPGGWSLGPLVGPPAGRAVGWPRGPHAGAVVRLLGHVAGVVVVLLVVDAAGCRCWSTSSASRGSAGR